MQHTVVILRRDLVRLDAAEIKLPAVGAIGTLAADIFVLLVLFLVFGMTLGADGQHVAVDIEVDVLLVEAGQIRFQLIMIALILDVGLEFRQAVVAEEAERIAEKAALQLVHFVERVIESCVLMRIRSEFKHTNPSVMKPYSCKPVAPSRGLLLFTPIV